VRETWSISETRPGRRSRGAISLVALFFAAFVLCANAFGHAGGVDQNGCHFQMSTGKRHCHAKPATDKPGSVCNQKAPVPGDENVLYGRVVSITDGDTFKAKIQGVVMTFRMADIDAPEMDQPYGREARSLLAAALEGKDVVMLRVDNDPYSRIVAQVYIANLHINREVMARGAAWFDREYAHGDCLYQVENAARDARLGLWALPVEKRMEPWVWRKRKRDAAAAQHRTKSAAK
jgi:endonuclease YncB( thermonuclease family)